jgi:sortase A
VGGLAVFTNSDGHDATAASTLPAPDDVADAPTTSVPATTVAPTSPTTTEPEPAPTTAAKKKAKKKKPQPTTTPAPTTSAPTTTAAPLEPIAPPSDTRGWEESAHLGGISIPKLGVDVPLYEGIRLTTLDKGPGHWPGTAMPGHDGNAVVAAHRTSHGAPFRYIDTLVPGDEVFFDTEIGQTRYLVTATEIVPPSALWIVDQTEDATATLFACHPPGSVAERIVVHLELAVD